MNRSSTYALAFAAVATLSLISSPVRASDADDAVESSFNKSYVSRTYLKDDSVKAEAKSGVLTLSGTVANEFHKTLALETGAYLVGVTRVENKLSTKAEVAADNADTWTTRKVQLALLFHSHVNAGKTNISVKDGVVTLRGEAESKAQKELTGEYAADVDSVKSVKNELVVMSGPTPAHRTAGEKLDDASISAQVKTALMTHRSTNSVRTKIQTRNGEVTLTGIAKNSAEKALVSKLTEDIQGVTGVKNQMTVQEVKTK